MLRASKLARARFGSTSAVSEEQRQPVDDAFELTGIELVEHANNAGGQLRDRRRHRDRLRCYALTVGQHRPLVRPRNEPDIRLAECGQVVESHVAVDGDPLVTVDVEIDGGIVHRRRDPGHLADGRTAQQDAGAHHETLDVRNRHRQVDAVSRWPHAGDRATRCRQLH